MAAGLAPTGVGGASGNGDCPDRGGWVGPGAGEGVGRGAGRVTQAASDMHATAAAASVFRDKPDRDWLWAAEIGAVIGSSVRRLDLRQNPVRVRGPQAALEGPVLGRPAFLDQGQIGRAHV